MLWALRSTHQNHC